MANEKVARSPRLSCTEEIEGVGVCQNDLHFVASAVAAGFGLRNPESPLDIVKNAINQASFELKLIGDQALQPNSDAFYSLLGVVERLEAAAESAEVLFKLLQLPNINNPNGSREVQP